jgi:sulfite exporter TauE/SafE
MCGGVCSALSFALPVEDYWRRWFIILGYNIGRITSYVLMALLISSINLLLAEQLNPSVFQEYLTFLRISSGVVMVMMGLYVANWWLGLQVIEKIGQRIWRAVVPLTKSLLPVRRLPVAFVYGMVWGWLPCGLVYSALVLSITQTSIAGTSATMLAFGLGTLPALFLSGVLASKLSAMLNKSAYRMVFGAFVILFGCLTIYSALAHNHPSGEDAAEHGHHHHH